MCSYTKAKETLLKYYNHTKAEEAVARLVKLPLMNHKWFSSQTELQVEGTEPLAAHCVQILEAALDKSV